MTRDNDPTATFKRSCLEITIDFFEFLGCSSGVGFRSMTYETNI